MHRRIDDLNSRWILPQFYLRKIIFTYKHLGKEFRYNPVIPIVRKVTNSVFLR